MTKTLIATAAALTIAFATPASAATIVFANGAQNPPLDGTDGNLRVFSSGGITVQATAWSFSSLAATDPTQAYLGFYSAGLGVTNNKEENGQQSGNNQHTTDNILGYDFVLLVFNQKVTLTSAVLKPFDVTGGSAVDDNDAWYSFAPNAPLSTYQPGAPTSTTLTTPNSLFDTLLSNGKYAEGGSSGDNYLTTLDNGKQGSNVWAIGAARTGTNDGFKISAITVSAIVPEPMTWTMMIAGFGLVGATLRNRKRSTGNAFAF